MKKLILSLIFISSFVSFNFIDAKKYCYCGIGCTVRELGSVKGDGKNGIIIDVPGYGKLCMCQKRDIPAFSKNQCLRKIKNHASKNTPADMAKINACSKATKQQTQPKAKASRSVPRY